jgi:hypothetical protein
MHWVIERANPLTEVAHVTRGPAEANWLRRWNHRGWTLVYTFNTATRWRIGSTADPKGRALPQPSFCHGQNPILGRGLIGNWIFRVLGREGVSSLWGDNAMHPGGL